MTRWQVFIAVLLSIPILVFGVLGTWTIWQSGWFLWTWWILPLCWGAAFLVARSRKVRLVPLPDPRLQTPLYWTSRDEEAWRLIESRAKACEQIPLERLTEVQLYLETAKELSLAIAQFYHPKATDPVGSLTIPEILAAAQLALTDLAELVDKNLPGSHLLTVDKWKLLGHVPDSYRMASSVYWLVSALFGPQLTLGRYALSKLILEPVTRTMQSNVLVWFYISYLHRVGFFLIEMNSGRLRAGAQRYDSMRHAMIAEGIPMRALDKKEPTAVIITVIGQVKAGKSSLINALLGERKAATDVLPETRAVQRYRLTLKDSPTEVFLLDTPGYADAGATRTQIEEAQKALRDSDLVLLVMDVSSPARDADVKFVQTLMDWCAKQPQLRTAPIVGVLTHVDLLTPATEWAPPYDWLRPKRVKERKVREALDYNGGVLAPHLSAIVAVCAREGRTFGIDEYLLPIVMALLPKARALALLRSLHTEFARGRTWKAMRQLLRAGTSILEGSIARIGPPS